MIVVTVELHSARDGHKEVLGKVLIANDGTGTKTLGNYDVWIGRRHEADVRKIHENPIGRGRVEKHARLRSTIFDLVRKALNAAYEEKKRGRTR